MYGFYEKNQILRSAYDDGEVATALAYNNAIGDEESTWMMIEPMLVTRFSVQAITAFTVTTEPVVALFRKAKTASGVGADDTSTNAAFMTDSGESFTTNEFVGWTIYNITDGSSGIITANAATTVTATLSGGTDNDWDSGDKYVIGYKLGEISIPTGTAIGDVIFCDIPNVVNAAGTGSTTETSSDYYKRRGPAEIFAGEQLAVFSTTLGVGSAGTFQPYVIGSPLAEVAANQSKMSATA
jgi:hypothetical protein